jgi:N-acetylmuramoyl-L-alanine amidase CwlA
MTVAPPHPQFIAARWFGGKQDKIRWIVLHSTVTSDKPGTAYGVAKFFHTEAQKTSAHYVVDAKYRYQCVPDSNVAYHCGYNDGSIAVEMCEMPSQDITRWDDTDHRLLEINAAHLVARLCASKGVRPWYVGWVGLKLGINGVTTHNDMSKAFKMSTHWDPGAWRRVRFMREVRAHYKHLKSANA